MRFCVLLVVRGALTGHSWPGETGAASKEDTMASMNNRIIDGASSQEVLDAAAKFAEDNVDLLEALRIFGMSTVQYEKAVRAMSAAPTCTTASTAVR